MPTPDVLIVGGGLVGCLCALRLAEGGARVRVLERSIPGAEASSAAAGILAAQSESRAPGILFDLALESRAAYSALADELRARVGIDIGYRRCGVVEAAFDDASLDAMERTYAWQRDAGHRVERWSVEDVRRHEPALATRAVGALAFRDDAQVEPPRLVSAVAQAAERAGATFRTGCTVRRVRVEGDRAVGIDVEDGLLEAGHVVIAAGAWSALVEGAQLPAGSVRPARGQIVELTTRTPPIASVVFGEGGYLVPRADGRVVCGSTLEFVGFRNEVTAAGVSRILAMAIALVPALESATVSRMWSNFRPHTPDEVPVVGDAGVAGLTIATGHYRSGILMAPITAELVRDRVLHGRTRDGAGALGAGRASLNARENA